MSQTNKDTFYTSLHSAPYLLVIWDIGFKKQIMFGGAVLAAANRLNFITKRQDQTMSASAAFVALAAFFQGLSGGIGGILMAGG